MFCLSASYSLSNKLAEQSYVLNSQDWINIVETLKNGVTLYSQNNQGPKRLDCEESLRFLSRGDITPDVLNTVKYCLSDVKNYAQKEVTPSRSLSHIVNSAQKSNPISTVLNLSTTYSHVTKDINERRKHETMLNW